MGGGGGCTCRLSVKISLLCRLSVKNFDLCRQSVIFCSFLVGSQQYFLASRLTPFTPSCVVVYKTKYLLTDLHLQYLQIIKRSNINKIVITMPHS